MLLIIAFVGFFLCKPFLYGAVLLGIGCLYFFRDPERECTPARHDPTLLVSPADGYIIDIQYDSTNNIEGYAYKVSIFLSIFDVHINRVPIAGHIQSVIYVPGRCVPAFVPKSSHLNEHNDLVIKTDNGRTILVRQIAGIIARRIVCFICPGDAVSVGQRFGLIKFGSRVDILLPVSVQLYITKGQRVVGGQTVIGRLL